MDARTKTIEQFIIDAQKVHGNKYDYSKVEYKNNYTKVIIICPVHGEFWQQPSNHILGSGCKKCADENLKKPIYGIGINDCEGSTYENGKQIQSYKIWRRMLQRCYDEKFQDKGNPTYRDCTVCKEWHLLSNFKEWFDENQIEGYELDKDIIIKGNKVYSPKLCCFVPQEINGLFIKKQNYRGEYPIGVRKEYNKYRATVNVYNKAINLGGFDTPEEAFEAYKEMKEHHIKNVADKWENRIAPNVYEALYNYKVEITD